jgi:hypothetical protein
MVTTRRVILIIFAMSVTSFGSSVTSTRLFKKNYEILVLIPLPILDDYFNGGSHTPILVIAA